MSVATVCPSSVGTPPPPHLSLPGWFSVCLSVCLSVSPEQASALSILIASYPDDAGELQGEVPVPVRWWPAGSPRLPAQPDHVDSVPAPPALRLPQLGLSLELHPGFSRRRWRHRAHSPGPDACVLPQHLALRGLLQKDRRNAPCASSSVASPNRPNRPSSSKQPPASW